MTVKAWALLIHGVVIRIYVSEARAKEDDQILSALCQGLKGPRSDSMAWEIQETTVHDAPAEEGLADVG